MPTLASPWRVPFDGSFRIAEAPSQAATVLDKQEAKHRLAKAVESISTLQEALYAENRQALLVVFQAMDAAGKDGTIRRLLTGVNPVGCQVFSFKRPSAQELDHDFLWRHVKALPERGRIGIHNRSWYEEVLVVRVNPGILTGGQRLPAHLTGPEVWDGRMRSIRDFEAHLARNGTPVVKFFLNVSREEQARRLVARIDEPDKRWKFDEGDLDARDMWPSYMQAYEQALNATSREEAPWYAVPADHKWTMRVLVAELVAEHLKRMNPQIPSPEDIDWEAARARLSPGS